MQILADFFLVTVAIGGVVYVFLYPSLSGERKAEQRMQSVTKTEPLAAFYNKVSVLHRIDGNRDRDAVFSEISRLIEDKTPK